MEDVTDQVITRICQQMISAVDRVAAWGGTGCQPGLPAAPLPRRQQGIVRGIDDMCLPWGKRVGGRRVSCAADQIVMNGGIGTDKSERPTQAAKQQGKCLQVCAEDPC